MTSLPFSSLISSLSDFLPRLKLAKSAEMPPLLLPRNRIGSPNSIGSTLVTLAPCSAIIMAAKEAVIIVENSITFIPSNGFICFSSQS